jgi:hypothetical protein
VPSPPSLPPSARRARRRVRGPLPRNTWEAPIPLGYPGSVQALGGLAAPLLAGASFTMTALLLPAITVDSPGSTPFARWGEIGLTLFVAAGLALVGSVQAAVWARYYDTTPDELAQWYPGEFPDDRPTGWVRALQNDHMRRSLRWASATRGFYHAGITLLLAGVAVVAVPPAPAGEISAQRWLLIVTSTAGAFGEMCWIVIGIILHPLRRRVALAHLGALAAAVFALVTGVGSGGVTGDDAGQWLGVAVLALAAATLCV